MKHLSARLQHRGQGGFTLIELLVVIAILGILAAVVVFAVGNTTDSAQEKACKTEKQTILTAMEAYRANAGDPAGYAQGPGWTDQMVGTGATNYLQTDPSARFPFVNTPGALAGTGVCAGI